MAGLGLAAQPLQPWGTVPLADGDWRDLVGLVSEHRLQGLLARACDDGVLPTTQAQRAHARERHREALGHVLRVEALLLAAVRCLTEAGIDHRVLKGAAVARLDYPDPTLRLYGDVDLLVPAAQLAAAVEALGSLGARRTTPPVGASFERRFAKGVDLRLENSLEIDVHRSLAREPFGVFIATERLFAQPSAFELDGAVLPAMDRACRFLHACLHAGVGDVRPGLVAVRDVAQLLASPELDDVEVWTAARTWRACAVVREAVALAEAQLGFVTRRPLVDLARAHVVTPTERRALAAARAATGRQLRLSLVTVRMLPTLRDRVAYLAPLAWPSGAFVGSRGGRIAGWRRSMWSAGQAWASSRPRAKASRRAGRMS